MNRNQDGFPVWDTEMEQELFTAEEIVQNNRIAESLCKQIVDDKES